MAPSSLAERVLYSFGLAIGRIFYRVRATGREHLPAGGFLLLPNHITWVDAIVLQLACPRRIRFVIDESFYRNRLLRPFLRTAGCIPITARQAKRGIELAAERLRAGEIVCLFPEGQLSRSGTLLRLRRGYELIAREGGAPVVPVWLDQLWGSIFSFQGGRFFTKLPRRIPYRVLVAFGKPLSSEAADLAAVREELLKLGEFCFSERPILRQNLARACLRGLQRNPFRTAVVDGFDCSELSRGKLLGAAAALSREIIHKNPERRIGIVLPPGKGGVLANLAVILAGKVPVNLNFTSSGDAIESATAQAGLRTIISAHAMAKRLQDFPWTPNVINLEDALPPLKLAILRWWIAGLVLPTRLLANSLGIPKQGDRAEAILLFTSGSSAAPKGVPLTHRNILGNVAQFAAMLDAREDDLILAFLPFFHSFGCTVTLWYPLIEGVRTLTYPNPLEAGKIAALAEKFRATIMLAAPTFLRAYLRKAEATQLRTLRLVITGAEKLPAALATSFEEKFGKGVLEGYGLTETSPVVSVNLPEPKAKRGEMVQPSSRLGSTGKLAPGIAAEIRAAETGEKLSLHDSGMLWLRGPNIFEGYLDDAERSAAVLRDGWFKTGDLGRFDEDGFLYIDGRLSRFSKIAGEMVAHEAVEREIAATLQLEGKMDRVICVLGVPDEAKGETLVLISSIDIDLATLRTRLAENGLPNLWIPRVVRMVPAIPTLASGKLDLARCHAIALGQ